VVLIQRGLKFVHEGEERERQGKDFTGDELGAAGMARRRNSRRRSERGGVVRA
jgi:hypothetical protein